MTRRSTTLFISMISIFSLATHSAARTHTCADTLPLASNDSAHRSALPSGHTDCFETTHLESGIWHLVVIGAPSDEPILEIQDSDGRPMESDFLTRSTGEKTIYAEAGSFILKVRAQDPTRDSAAYRILSRFVPVAPLTKDEDDPGELELESEGLVAHIDPYDYTKDEDDPGELELESEGLVAHIDPYDHTKDEDDPGELELESEGFTAPSFDDPLRAALCSHELSDGNDSLLCAQSLRTSNRGRWDHHLVDDADVYRFSTTSWQTVRWTVSADAGISGRLFDDRGQALQAVSADGELVWTRHLAPGVYFLRLSADRPASYRTTFERLP